MGDGLQRVSLEPNFDAEGVKLFPIERTGSRMQATLYGYVLVPRFLHDHRCQISFVSSAAPKQLPAKNISSSQRGAATARYKVARTVGEALHLGASFDDLFRDYWL